MNYIRKRWIWILSLVTIMTLVFVTPAFAQDGPPPEVADATLSINIMWMILGGFLVFFMQAGFALVETGFTQIGRAHV